MTKLKQLLLGAALAATASVAAGAANAAVTIVSFSGFQVGLNAGETLVSDFDNP